MKKRNGEQNYEDMAPKGAEPANMEDILGDEGAKAPRRAPKGRAAQSAKEQKSRAVLVRLVLLLLCLVGIPIAVQELFFKLEVVYVEGHQTKTPQQITGAAGLARGMNTLWIKEDTVKRNVNRDHTLEFVRMEKEYPNTIYLFVKERKSVSAFQANGYLYTLDEQGIVMSESSDLTLPEGMPEIKGFQKPSAHVGQRVVLSDPKQLSAYQAIIAEIYLQLYSSQVQELNLANSENLYLTTVDGITVRMGNHEYARAKIGAIRTDMAYLRQLGKNSGVLDVSIPEDAKYTSGY